ncbi:HAD family hydrolase [uncultured Ilumatobacter sp.]|jgi:hypothetical protein|uniref:sulfotransferase-like domain-containing protein n=1 Tax=uncultured Ilumatobacter sp. TaxID=879968 RepID=UPI00374EC140
MWSGPRNLSTAMMRSWENRVDTAVIDEPLYAAYLATTRLDHPGLNEIVAAGPAVFDDAIAACLAPLPDGIAVSYQKHMAHHLLPDMDRSWLGDLRNVLLLRDPRRVLASYTKVRESVTLDDIGVPQQVELAQHCEIVVDSDDFLADPAGYQREICRRLDVSFDSAMLAWPAGPRASDGVWAPHWYSTVEASTSFGPPPADPPASLPPHLALIADEASAIYDKLRADRLTI